MKNKYPIRAAVREAKRRKRLNRGYWCCFRCTATLLEDFIPVSLDWLEKRGIPSGLLEAHHVVGKAHDAKLTVPLCRNCHALATEDLLRAGVSMKPTADTTNSRRNPSRGFGDVFGTFRFKSARVD